MQNIILTSTFIFALIIIIDNLGWKEFLEVIPDEDPLSAVCKAFFFFLIFFYILSKVSPNNSSNESC